MDTKTTQTPARKQPSVNSSCPVVGIGASAGGLEAFTRLLEHLPATTGMAYVFVQHLDPTHTSLLPGLLVRLTTMPVCEGEDGMVVEPDHVYVVPPNTDMTLEQGVLKLRPRTQTSGQHFSIDALFRSLAHDRKHQAIGVLLSGTASDGTLGLRAIKAEGGITFAQDEHSAKFPQMPHNAIVDGCVDRILPPEEIARELTRLSLHPHITQDGPVETPETPLEEEQNFTRILSMLRNQTGVDFLSYKPTTLKRRILHRMAVLHIERLADYVTCLRDHRAEVEALYQDVLIHVTSFFRDPDAFDALSHLVFPELVQHLAPGDSIRIWVAGCSTGEEAYSLAICLREFLEERSLTLSIHIFATDINPKALEYARAGVYPVSALSTVSPQRLQRFFVPVDRARERYRIGKTIREWCIFALHNVAKDPPFSRLDLVSCRNVLMYMGPVLQQKVIQTFHYALGPQGFLLLGPSESVDPLSRLFSRVERHLKLYRKKATESTSLLSIVTSGEVPAVRYPGEGGPSMPEETSRGFDIQQEADQLLLANYAPASVVIDADMEILHFRGHTGPYLEPAPGKASFNLLSMAREGLGLGLRTAIQAAREGNYPVTKEGVQVISFGTSREVRLTVIPLKGPPAERYFLVLFEEVPARSARVPGETPLGEQAGRASKRSATARRIAALEQELTASRAEMQAMLEERDATNEELQSANEEIQANNEELQSANEELETSKEELQAINEELVTANQELHTRNEQLKASQEYAEAVVETVREPLVVLDADMRVQRANTSFYRFFGVVPQDTEGRYLYDLGSGQWNIPRLRVLLEEVLSTNQSFQDFEVEHTFPVIGHKIVLLNTRRILREREKVRDHLLLLSIEDITERRELERQKDALLGMVSHELKTPLTSAKLNAQLLHKRMMQVGDEQSATHLSKLDEQLNTLTHLIDDLLDATAIETGTILMHPATFAMDDLVRDIVEELGRTNPTARLLMEGEAHSEVYADRERTGQVLINLLTNAIKYSPQAEPVCVRASADEDMITVSVQDRGVGIPKEQQARIFERFYRASDREQKKVSGIGLGLYIAAEIVKRQGGRIWLESMPGEGSTFSFTVPRRKPQ